MEYSLALRKIKLRNLNISGWYTRGCYPGKGKQMPHVLSSYVDLILETLIWCVQLGWKAERGHWEGNVVLEHG